MARWPTALLVGVFVVGYALVASVLLVRGRVLDAAMYQDALVRNDAYERVYTEVLADPELAGQVELLLGGLRFHELDPAQVRALSTSALRWSVPPSTIRRGTETFLAATLGYVRGDRARLDGDVDLAAVLDRLDESTGIEVRTLLAGVTERSIADLDEYRSAVASFAEQLRSGTVPGSIPVLYGEPAQAAAVLLDQFGGLDAARREQVVAAVQAADARDGLVNAVDVDTDAVRDRLATALEDGRHLDVITEIADRAGRSKAAIVGRLDSARGAAGWFRLPTAVVGAVLMAGAAGGLVWLHRTRPRRAGLALAAAAVAAGLVVLALWAIVGRAVGSPLDPALSTGPGSWNLPGGVRSLLADVSSTIGDELTATVRRLVLVPVAAGVVAAVLLVAAPRLWVAGGAVAVVGVAAGLASTGAASAAEPARLCNGHTELCERRYDEVVYAATHNSMSSPDVVFVWPEQDADIRAQLDDGVRALLIDTHHWTSLVSPDQLTFLPPDIATSAYGRLGALREPRDGAFLCHNECALGAIPFLDSMATVRAFLDENPDDVVTLIIQDAISPEETAAVVAEAGLDRYLHTHQPGTAWATLDELIDRDERLVVFAENEGPPPAWYHPAFELMQDTPFRFAQPSELSCAPNRGPDDAPLFLVNHWVQRVAPDRAVAADVNRHDVIVDRARQCRRERDRMPNYIAVDFANIGGLIDAVATLNEVD